MSNSKTTLFEKAPVHKAFFALALPSVFGKIIMLLYNLADTWFIASTNNTDIVAGVSLVAPVFMVMIALGDIFGVGGSSLISRLMGNRQKEDTKRISTLCFYSALILGGILAVLLLILKNPILAILGTDQNTLTHASDYYTYIAIGAPFILACVVPMNLLRAEGMAKASMFGSITGSVVNIILDPLFIFEFQMGAAGAAIATTIGTACILLFFLTATCGLQLWTKEFCTAEKNTKIYCNYSAHHSQNRLFETFLLLMLSSRQRNFQKCIHFSKLNACIL